jgi:di/tricarboxylate transporter
MTVADLSIVVLVALFAATALPRFNLGLAALPAAFLIGLLGGYPAEEVTAFFPGDFFVLIVGVTALFAAAQLNGTLDFVLDLLLRLVRGRYLLVVLVPFVIGAVLTTIGTLPAAAVAIVSPIALGLSFRYGIAPLPAAVLGITGILSGMLSPLAVYGVTTRELGSSLELGLPASAPVTFVLGNLVAGLGVCAGILLIGTRTGAIPRGRVPVGAAAATTQSGVLARSGPGSATAARVAAEDGQLSAPPGRESAPVGTGSVFSRTVTLLALAAVVVLSIGLDMNIGYLGLTAALVLQLLLRIDPDQIVSRVPWNVVLLIGGLLTYVNLMQELGAFERISDLLRVEGAPYLTLLVICYIAGITSFAASSIAVFVTAMPLLPSVVAEGVSPVGAVLALAVSAVIVDVNPVGITGGLILGSADPSVRQRLFRQLLVYGAVSVVVGPLIAWAAFSWW